MSIRSGLLAAALLLLLPALAAATVAPSKPRVRWAGPVPTPAQAGRETAGSFQIRGAGAGAVHGLRLEGDGWTVTSLDAPADFYLEAGEVRTISFRAVPTDPDAPLVARFGFDDAEVRRSFPLGPAKITRPAAARAVRFADAEGPRLSGSAQPLRGGGINLRFLGQVRYVRGDSVDVAADGIQLRVMDDDSPGFDEEIWSGVTNPDGTFDVTVFWDDCDLVGCDDPDIYLVISCAGPNVDVHADDLGQTTYEWTTPELTDFQGDTVDFGVMYPGLPSEYGALHLYTSVVRAHRFAQVHGGMDAPFLEAFWPDDDDGTAYSSTFQEMYVTTGETWVEGTHHHEFGHHLQNIFAQITPSNYDNGYCDPGHCAWCPENPTDAWQEGWGNWFGSVVSRDYQATYGVTPMSINDTRYVLELPSWCSQDSVYYPMVETEGYVGLVLRDIEDSQNEDADGGAADCDTDALNLGAGAIFTVFDLDEPTTYWEFLDGFRARNVAVDQDAWSTVRNHAIVFGFPTELPVITSQPETCVVAKPGEALALHAQGNGSLLKYQWRKDGVDVTDGGAVSGATTPDLAVSYVSPITAGVYDCVVSTCNELLSLTSPPTAVSVVDFVPANALVSWGLNGQGQVGDSTQAGTPHPPYQHGAPADDIVSADGGYAFGVAVKEDGTVLSWGQESYGELGNGPGSTTQLLPTPVPGLADCLQVSSATYYSLIVRRDGGVVGFGWNGEGQLGDGTFLVQESPVPTLVTGCARAVATGTSHALALMADGTVQAWGANYYGERGWGALNVNSSTPTTVPGLTDVVEISAAGYWSLARKSDGTVWSWGLNDRGQLGVGDLVNRTAPTQVPGLTDIESIAAVYYNGYAVSEAGPVHAWGSGQYGQMGDGVFSTFHTTPQVVPGLTGVFRIDGGDGLFTIAMLSNATLQVWGQNPFGAFGTATPAYALSPIPVPQVAGVSGFGASYGTVHAYGHIAAVDVTPTAPAAPTVVSLSAGPNPFTASTTLAFDLPAPGAVHLDVYDVTGRRVRTLVDGTVPAGRHRMGWDGRDEGGAALATGVYFLRLETPEGSRTGRVVRVR